MVVPVDMGSGSIVFRWHDFQCLVSGKRRLVERCSSVWSHLVCGEKIGTIRIESQISSYEKKLRYQIDSWDFSTALQAGEKIVVIDCF